MRKERGFTLVEVLLATGILSVLVVSVSALFILSFKVNVAAGDQTQCVALAQQQMETLKHVDYDTLHNGGSIETPTTGYCQYVDTDADYRNDFVVSWAVSNAGTVSGSLSADKLHVAQLDVRCTALRGANAQPGRPKRVTLLSYRARGTEL